MLASLSTGNQDQLSLLGRIVDALGACPCAESSRPGTPSRRRSCRRRPTSSVVRSAPHSAILEQAAAVVTHGGHGTLIKALAADVPLLVVPMGRDQLDNATRVTERGAGLQLGQDAEPEAIAEAVRRLLDEPAFAEGAGELGARIREDAAGDAAVAELEALARDGAAACA